MLPYAVRVPSRFPPGTHRIRVNWEGCGQKLERVFTFTMENPDFGKRVPDALAEKLKLETPDAKLVVLQQGLPAEELKIEAYAGCADTFLATRHLDTKGGANNYGAKDHLWVGPYGSEHRTLIRYDLAALPAGAKVKQAYLRLFQYTPGGADLVQAHRILRDWGAGRGGEDQEMHGGRATNGQDWQHVARPPLDGECNWLMAKKPEPWAAPGCGKAGEDYAADVLSSGSGDTKQAEGRDSGGPTRYWSQWEITAAVRAWLEKPEQNFGILLRHTDENKTQVRFFSSDYHDPIYRPRLVIVYE